MKRLVAAGAGPHLPDRPRLPGRARAGPTTSPSSPWSSGTAPDEPLDAVAADCEALLRAAAAARWAVPEPRRYPWIDRRSNAPRCGSCCARHAGIDLAGDETARGCWPPRRAAAGVDPGIGHRLGRRLLPGLPRPHRARTSAGRRPTFVFDWPAPLAALARRQARRPPPGRTLRALRRRPGAGQRLRRADGPARAAGALPGRGRRAPSAGAGRLPHRRDAAGGAGPHAAHQRDRPGLRPPGDARPGPARHPGGGCLSRREV